MFSALRPRLRDDEAVAQIEYRNLAPLYAGEPMAMCVRRNPNPAATEGDRWDVWVEGPDGGLAVRGVMLTKRTTCRPT